MKASKLIEALARQIGEHGDKDVYITVSIETEGMHEERECTIRGVLYAEYADVLEIYGEE
jgi:hypothetical protein